MPFLTDLKMQKLRDSKYFVLLAPLIYEYGGKRIEVPVGFKTDLASVPTMLLPITDGRTEAADAACIHDYLYFTGETSRSEADAIFKKAMEEIGVGWLRRNIMWAGVRVGAWLTWNKYRWAQ